MNAPDAVILAAAEQIEHLSAGVAELRADLTRVYMERNQLVAALSKHYDSHLAIDETVEPQWRYVVCIHLPTGQVTWHIHEDEIGLFEHLEDEPRPQHWDGHTSDEKYRRLAALADRYWSGNGRPGIGGAS